ncbi:glucan endo-1,3-beta-glucosidase-like [Salvia divinorum]|uniref:Glucan endo-1,3-beta-glucosidase-like n=1 Tax=Salvia divinorum TaxID=28513 RepID=A0ABD1FPE7_SALDI
MATTLNHFITTMLILGLLVTISLDFTVAQIGVCYGRMGNDLISPRQVVDLYKRHNIKRMRTYDADAAILEPLRGSGIELNVVITNGYLECLAKEPNKAYEWVRDHVHNYPDVDLRYISVGNEVNPADSATAVYAPFVLPAMRNVYREVCRAGFGKRVKVTTTVGMNTLGASYPPEDTEFLGEVKPYLRPIVAFMVRTGAPFMANVYPYFAYSQNENINIGYALLESGHGIKINGVYYDNLFYAMVDAVYAAVERMVESPSLKTARGVYNRTLEKKGKNNKIGPKAESESNQDILTVLVTETGHPTHGGNKANMRNAKIYNQNLVEIVEGGTPRHPEPIETYIFALFNENEKPGAETERHFGLFYPNGQPKYDINFH